MNREPELGAVVRFARRRARTTSKFVAGGKRPGLAVSSRKQGVSTFAAGGASDGASRTAAGRSRKRGFD